MDNAEVIKKWFNSFEYSRVLLLPDSFVGKPGDNNYHLIHVTEQGERLVLTLDGNIILTFYRLRKIEETEDNYYHYLTLSRFKLLQYEGASGHYLEEKPDNLFMIEEYKQLFQHNYISGYCMKYFLNGEVKFEAPKPRRIL